MSDTNSMAEGLEQLLALEEKINQTIDLLKSTQAEKGELLRENVQLRREWEQQNEVIQKLEDRLGRLEKEREAVRGRIQRLLEQVDSLTREKSG
jgi:FtsZ-binding cell division protein ZapB